MMALGAVSCAEQQNSVQSLASQNITGAQQPTHIKWLSSNALTVLDKAGQPIVGATILLGYEPGNPFQGNVLTTDAQGIAGVPADWKAALPVTVQAQGFVSQTLPVTLPGDLNIQLSPQEGADLQVAGETTDFGRLVTDGKVDFGLVIPAMGRDQLLSFDMSTVISPATDKIEIIGNEVELPSNITLPDQRETYIFPITLNKPAYRVFLRNPGQYTVSATRGQFPLQRVVNDIRAGKSIFELVNHFTFISGGQRAVDVNGNVTGANLAVNQVPFNTQVGVRAPNFATTQVMMSLALTEQNGLMAPTDLKRLNPGQSLNLKSTAAAGAQQVLSLLMDNAAALIAGTTLERFFAPVLNPPAKVGTTAAQDFSKLTFAIQPAAGGVAPEFLPMVNKPEINGNVVTLDMPALPNGLTAIATYLVFSEIEKVGTGATATERRTRLWEVWNESWINQVELPQIEFTRNPNRVYRWEVMFLAGPSHFVRDLNLTSGVDLNSVSHVTRNAVDL